MLSHFPYDVSILLVSYLRLQDVCKLRLLNRETRDFIQTHSSDIYHQLSISYRFVLRGRSVDDTVTFHSTRIGQEWIGGAHSWEELFRRWHSLERNWDGKGYVVEGGHFARQSSRMHVRHFAVDERDRTILISTVFDLFAVHDLDTHEILWTIPGNAQNQSVSHFVWSEGFLAFSTHSGSVEIWRRWTDVLKLSPQSPLQDIVPTPLSNVPLAPSVDQLSRASPPPRPDEDLRGKYAPHALIIGNGHSRSIRVLKMCFPIVIVIYHLSPYAVHVFDIAEGIKLRTIQAGELQTSGAQPESQTTTFTGTPALMDVYVAKNYLVLTYDSIIAITAIRPQEEDQYPTVIIVEPDHPIFVRKKTPWLKSASAMSETQSSRVPDIKKYSNEACVGGRHALDPIVIAPPPELDPEEQAQSQALISHRFSPMFLTAALSPDQRHLVIGSTFRFVYLFPDFARIGKGYNTNEEVIQRLYLDSPIMSVSWAEQDHRFAMTTDDGLTFVVNLDPTYHNPEVDSEDAESHNILLTKASIHCLSDFRMLDFSGLSVKLQMTKTRLWLIWDYHILMKYVEDRRLAREKECKSDGDELARVQPPEFSQSTYTASVCYVDFTPRLPKES